MFDKFMPHGMCYIWRPDILWLNVGSDAIIALAYFSIPVLLIRMLLRKPDIPFPRVIIMFILFILACGFSHLMGIWIVWNGHYGLQGLVKAVTACISIATALLLYPVLPQLLALRSPKELEIINQNLKTEVVNRKISELKTLTFQHELAHMGRITSMGQMASGLAHELNQPLTAISQYVDAAKTMAGSSGKPDADIAKCLSAAEEEAHRASKIIKAMRSYISKDNPVYTKFAMQELIEETTRLARPDATNRQVAINVKSSHEHISIGDRVQVAQVLYNLIRNAVDAIANANAELREVTISTIRQGNKINVSVKDSGPGLKSKTDLFQPFYTTKPEGLGLGLSISRTIVESHGGELWLDSLSDGGSCFWFSLPTDKS